MSTDTKREPWLVEAGHRFRDIRNRAALTQQELADSARVSRQTISNLERGETWPNTETRLRLSYALRGEEPNLWRVLLEER
jgi:DNA-binding XRE family transcriptional regulator